MKTDQKNFTLSDNNKGFTLIETLIAMAIFAIGVLAVGSMQISSVRNTTTGNITTQATQLARAQMEELKSQNISTLTDGHYEDPNNFVDANGNAGGIYTRFWDIDTPGVCSVSGSCRRITVTVRWSRLGQNRSVVLTSITRGNGI